MSKSHWVMVLSFVQL